MVEESGVIKLVDEEEGIFLLEEDGEQHRFKIVESIKIVDDNYLLLALEDDEDSEEVYAWKVIEDDKGEAYRPVIEEEELLKIQKELENK